MGFSTTTGTTLDPGVAGDTVETTQRDGRMVQSVAAVSGGWRPLRQPLDTVGDGSGTVDLTADYSSADEEFFIAPAAGEIFVVEKLLWILADDSITAFTLGGITPPSAGDGLLVSVQNGSGVIAELINGGEILSNLDLERYSEKTDVYAAHLVTLYRFLMDFGSSGGAITLDGDAGEKLVVTARGNYSAITNMYVTALGYVLKEA